MKVLFPQPESAASPITTVLASPAAEHVTTVARRARRPTPKTMNSRGGAASECALGTVHSAMAEEE
ncbi:hypothetical protein [Phenylobacterium hankyongense]|uniref:hypothetical protein n=1 Tax=Phenylobacterium hankyongense TaxID=1813876 RepID=UPI0026C08ECB